MLLNLALWVGGVALLVAGAMLSRRPLARYRELRAVDENARRYDAWRGGTRTAVGATGGEVTGADVMRVEMRRRVILAIALVVTGIAMVLLGFIVR